MSQEGLHAPGPLSVESAVVKYLARHYHSGRTTQYRVWLPSDVRLSYVLDKFRELSPETVVYVCTNLRAGRAPILGTETSASAATEIRNDNLPLLVLGSAEQSGEDGQPEGGLKLPFGLLDKAALAQEWIASVNDHVSSGVGTGSELDGGTLALAESIIEAWEPSRVDGGTIVLSSVAIDRYLNDLLRSENPAKEAGMNLHQLELLQDQRINDLVVSEAGDRAVHKFYGHLEDNANLLRLIKHPNSKKEQSAVERLFASDEFEAKRLRAWIDDWDRANLEGVDLKRVRDLMRVESVAIDRNPNISIVELLRVPLQASANDADDVFWLPDRDGLFSERDQVIRALSNEIDAAWSDPDGHDPSDIEVDLWERGAGQPAQVRRVLAMDWLSDSTSSKKARSDWLDRDVAGGVYLGIVRVEGQEIRQRTKEQDLRTAILAIGTDQAVVDALDQYLRLRKNIIGDPENENSTAARLFLWQQSDENLLAMLLVNEHLRAQAIAWHEAWLDLLQTSSSDPKILGVKEISRSISGLECEQFESLQGDEDQISFASWHPLRLGGIANLALQRLPEESRTRNSAVSPDSANEVFAARPFALPIVSAFNSDRGGYWFVANGGRTGTYLYARKNRGSVAPAVNGGNHLSQLVQAFRAAHPWCSETGVSVLVVNPPAGTAMAQFYRSLARTFGSRVQLNLISGPLADFPEVNEEGIRVSARRTDNLSDWLEENRPRGQIALVFSPVENHMALQATSAAALSLGVGFGPKGLNDLQTQVTVNPSEGRSESLYLTKLYGSQSSPVLQHSRNPPTVEANIANDLLRSFEWVGFGVGGYASTDFGIEDANNPIKIAMLPIDGYNLQISTDHQMALIDHLANPVLESVQSKAGPKEVRQAITRAVEASPVDLLTGFLKKFGPEEAFGLLLASVAADKDIRERGDAEDLIATISLDRADFTAGWLSLSQQRADLIKIVVPGGPADRPVEIVVVESKATHAPYLDPDISKAPFSEAAEQVLGTVGNLHRLLGGGIDSNAGYLKWRRKALSRAVFRAVASHPRMARPGQSEKLIMERVTDAFNRDDGNMTLRGIIVSSFIDAMRRHACLRDAGASLVPPSDLTLLSLTRWDMQALLEGAEIMSGKIGSDAPIAEAYLPGGVRPEPVTGDAVSDPDVVVPHPRHAVPPDVGPSAAQPTNTRQLPTEEPESLSSLQSEELGKKAFNAARLYSSDLVDPKSVTVVSGPTFHLVSLKMMAGGNLQEVQRHEIDIARELGVAFVTVENDDVQGRIRMLIPRKDRQFPIRTASADPLGESISEDHYLGIKVGVDLYNREHVSYISQWVHTLVAGTTGSGKSTFLRSIVRSLGDIGRKGVSYIIVDGKGGNDFFDANVAGFDLEVAAALGDEEEAYRANPGALGPKHAVDVVDWLAKKEIPRRKEIANLRARELGARWDARKAYIQDVRGGSEPTLKPLVVIIDEFAQITLAKDDNSSRFQQAVKEIAQLSRAYLVHLILATQRPDAQVVPPLIKANAPSRIALKLPAMGDSMTILAEKGAESLAGKGDLILKPIEGEKIRLQGYSD